MVLCLKCGGRILVDQESVRQLARVGVLGGRIHCLAGCTDEWVRLRIEPTPLALEPGDGRGKYERPVRDFKCERCRRIGSTRGINTQRCKDCQAAVQRERDQVRWARKRQRLRAASVAVRVVSR